MDRRHTPTNRAHSKGPACSPEQPEEDANKAGERLGADEANAEQQSQRGLARSNFQPLERFLDHLGKEIATERGSSLALERRGEMQQIAQNMFEVRYSLHHPDEIRLSLTFIIIGDDANFVLLQGHQRSTSRDLSANPGPVDQHAYRLDEIGELENAVREKIAAHLEAHDASAAT